MDGCNEAGEEHFMGSSESEGGGDNSSGDYNGY